MCPMKTDIFSIKSVPSQMPLNNSNKFRIREITSFQFNLSSKSDQITETKIEKSQAARLLLD